MMCRAITLAILKRKLAIVGKTKIEATIKIVKIDSLQKNYNEIENNC